MPISPITVCYQDTSGNSVPVATTTPLPVAPQGYSAAVSLTRTADTNAYTANDVLGIDAAGSPGAAALEFDLVDLSGVAALGGQHIITSAKFEIDLTAIPSGMTSFRLYLYNETPPSALLDNAAWDLPSGDRASFKGYVDLGSPVDLGSTLYVETNGINKQLTVLAGGKLFGYLVTNGGYTPASGTVHKVTLHTIRV